MVPVLLDQPPQLAQLPATESTSVRQSDGCEPELGVALRLVDMDVRRLAVLPTSEEESVATDAQDGRHTGQFTPRAARATEADVDELTQS